METQSAKPVRPPIKRRDVLKFAFATILAVVTFAAIAGMTYAKSQRKKQGEDEVRRIRQTIEQYGTHGQLPEKINTQ